MKRNKVIPRQESLASPIIPNPFVHRIDFTTYDYFKIAFGTVFLLPIRVILILLLLLCGWVIAVVSLAFRTKEERNKPLQGWRRSTNKVLAFLGRLKGILFGFHCPKVKGRCADAAEAPVIVCCPHSSFFDGFLFFFCGFVPSIISRKENSSFPIFGTFIDYTQPVYVKREDPNSRRNTIKEIQRRANSNGEWPQVIIFPEGTCTNRTCVIGFKAGAFYPGVPVQPVCIKWPNRMDTVSWTWDGPGVWKLVWLTLCQFHNKLEIEFLPVYVPNEEEKKDAKLYANNVRKKMAECLGLPMTEHTFDDCRLMKKATQLKLPMSAGLVEFQKLNSKLALKYEDIQSMLDTYKSISANDPNGITLEKFAEYLHLPVSDAMREVFDLYDRNKTGVIDFREYVIGLSLISTPANTEETLKMAFELFDKESKGHLTQEELGTIIRNAFGTNESSIQALFHELDLDNSNKITYEDFKELALKKPEYASIFKTYQAMKEDNSGQTEVLDVPDELGVPEDSNSSAISFPEAISAPRELDTIPEHIKAE